MKELINNKPIVILPDRFVDELSIPFDTLTAQPTGGTNTVTFTNRGIYGITVTTGAQWLTARVEGTDLIITYEPNTGTYREASVTLSGKDSRGFTYDASVMVTQDSQVENGISAVIPKIVNLPSGKGEGHIDITGDTVDSVSVRISSDWIYMTSVEGQRINYRYYANVRQHARSTWATITLTKGADVRTYSVTFTQQALTQEKRIILTQGNSAYVGYNEGQTVVSFVCENTSCTDIVSDSDWITVEYLSGAQDGTALSPAKLSYGKNTGTAFRVGKVNFIDDSGETLAVFTVTQYGEAAVSPAGSVTASDIVIPAETTEGYIQLFHENIKVLADRIETDVDWIHSDDGENGDHQGGKGLTTVVTTPDGTFILYVNYPNTERKERTGHLIVHSEDDNGNEVVTRIAITQEAYVAKAFFPIWMDHDVVLSGIPASGADWALTSGGEVMKTARSVMDADGISRIRLNDMLRVYMRQRLDPSIVEQGQDIGGFVSGYLAVKDQDGNYVAHTAYSTWNDCSYEPTNRIILNDPVENSYDQRQLIPFSFIAKTGTLDGVITRKLNLSKAKVTTNHTAQGQIMTVLCKGFGQRPYDWIRLDVNGETLSYEMREGCPTHCLYYTNKYGGVDSLLLRGKVKKSDAIESYGMRIDTPTTSTAHSEITLQKEITRSWQLYTHYLSESQMAKMENVAETTLAYLHDLEADTIIPVNVTNTTFEFKTFMDGRRLWGEINVIESRERYRL